MPSRCTRAPALDVPAAVAALMGSVSLGAVAAPTTELAPLVVTATRTPVSLTDVLADVTIIDREELEQAGLQSLVDVLAQVAGVQMTANGSYRSNSGGFCAGPRRRKPCC